MYTIPQFNKHVILRENSRTLRKGLFSNLDCYYANTFMINYFVAQEGEHKGKLISPYSGEVIEQKNLSLEHVLQVRQGGGTTLWNCIPLEISLNIKRKKTDIIDFFEEMGYPYERLEKIVNYMLDALMFEYLNESAKLISFDKEKPKKYFTSKEYVSNKDEIAPTDNINVYIRIKVLEKKLNEKGIKTDLIQKKIAQLISNKVFENIDLCNRYEKILFQIIKKICPAMKYSVILSINFHKLLKSVGNLSEEQFYDEIIKRINLAQEIFSDFGCTLENTVGSIKEMPEILEMPEVISKEYVEANLSKIYLSDLYKKEILFKHLTKIKQMWPDKKEKFINGSYLAGFVKYNYDKKVCSDKPLNEEISDLLNSLGVVFLGKEEKKKELIKKILELKGNLPAPGKYKFSDGTDMSYWYNAKRNEIFNDKTLEEIVKDIRRNFGKCLTFKEKTFIFLNLINQNKGQIPSQPSKSTLDNKFSDGTHMRTWYEWNMNRKLDNNMTLLETVQKIQQKYGITVYTLEQKKEMFFREIIKNYDSKKKIVIRNLGYFPDGTSIADFYHHHSDKKISSTITLEEEFKSLCKSLGVKQTDYEKKLYLFEVIREKKGELPKRIESNGGVSEYTFKDGLDVREWYRKRKNKKIDSELTLEEEVKKVQMEFGFKKLSPLEKKQMLFEIIKEKKGILPKLKTHNNNQSEYLFPDGKDVRKWYDHNRKEYIGGSDKTLEEEVKDYQKQLLYAIEMEKSNGRKSL